MGALKLRKDVSKPGLLRVVRGPSRPNGRAAVRDRL